MPTETKTHRDRTNEKIKVGHILRRLLKHFDGSLELSASQVSVGLALLKKKLPDLKQMEHKGSVEHKHSQELSRDELLTIAAGGRTGSPEPGRSSGKPKELH
jgi:hypothetical protein